MPKTEDIIIAAINATQTKGIKLQRIPLSDGFDAPPRACNALGAVLLHHGLADLTKPLFNPSWLDKVAKILDESPAWISRFCCGWDNARHLTFTYDKDGKEHIEKDPTSRAADKLARKYGL